MEVFANLERKLDAVFTKKTSSIDFYSELVSKMVHLSSEQRKALITKAEQLNENDGVGSGSLALIKGMRSVFEADFNVAIEELSLSKHCFGASEFYGGLMSAENLLSVCFRSVGQLEKAQIHMQSALKALEKVKTDDPYWYFHSITFY